MDQNIEFLQPQLLFKSFIQDHGQFKTQGWQQYHEVHLARLQQQSFRMEAMAKTLKQYSQLLGDYELQNQDLIRQNIDLKNQCNKYQQDIQDNHIQSSELKVMLESLRKLNTTKYDYNYSQPMLNHDIAQQGCLYSPKNKKKLELRLPSTIEEQLYKDYEALAEMYSGLKDELLFLHRENIDLKTVIKNQSTLYNQLQNENLKLKPHLNESVHPKNRNGHSFEEREYSKQNIENTVQEKLIKNSGGHHPQDLAKIRNLKVQLRKQEQLIQKFKENQQQQLELIDMLKSQNSKVCLCHTYGASQKNLTAAIISSSRKLAPNSTAQPVSNIS